MYPTSCLMRHFVKRTQQHGYFLDLFILFSGFYPQVCYITIFLLSLPLFLFYPNSYHIISEEHVSYHLRCNFNRYWMQMVEYMQMKYQNINQGKCRRIYGTIKLLELKIFMIQLQCCVLLVHYNSVGLI